MLKLDLEDNDVVRGLRLRYKDFLESRRSSITMGNYAFLMKGLLAEQDPDEIARKAREDPECIRAALIGWVNENKDTKSPRTLSQYITVIRSFLDFVGVPDIGWKSVRSTIPRAEPSGDIPPTKGQLRKVYHSVDVRGKFILTLLSSAGMRVQFFNTAVVGDIEDKGEWGLVHVRKSKTGAYKTCCSKEALYWFHEYLRTRGGVARPDSAILMKAGTRERASSNSVSSYLNVVWRRVLGEEEAEKLHSAHCLRKYHETTLLHSNGNIPGMADHEVHLLQNHATGGIIDIYDKPSFEDKLAPEYLRRQHWLLVDEKYELQNEMESRTGKVETDTEKIKRQNLELTEEIARLKESQAKQNETLQKLLEEMKAERQKELATMEKR